jgi:hypothetical protein
MQYDRYVVLHFWIICLNKHYTLLADSNKLIKHQLKNMLFGHVIIELKHENYVCSPAVLDKPNQI